MTYWNLILGRSWQFSRRVMHDGYENIYLVQQGRMKYKLYPLVRSLYWCVLEKKCRKIDIGQGMVQKEGKVGGI